MRIAGPDEQPVREELDLLAALLSLEGARLLELGCGAANKTRAIADGSAVAHIVASEVDPIQHRKNLALGALPRVSFASFGAEAIDAPDGHFDGVLMFKSLHHVPVPLMDSALKEIARVLKPGGFAYLSEPVFAGDFNDVIRLFHDESRVRRSAFEAAIRAVDQGLLSLERQVFFKSRLRMEDFAQFEADIINVTHTEHRLSAEVLAEVRARFESHAGPEGYVFLIPHRIDLLRKPSTDPAFTDPRRSDSIASSLAAGFAKRS